MQRGHSSEEAPRIESEVRHMADEKRDVIETIMDGYAQKDGAMEPDEGDSFLDEDDVG